MRGFRPEGERDLVFVPLKDKDRKFFRVRAAKMRAVAACFGPLNSASR
jgi:hypothetical protein